MKPTPIDRALFILLQVRALDDVTRDRVLRLAEILRLNGKPYIASVEIAYMVLFPEKAE